jgi:hypothetical protein
MAKFDRELEFTCWSSNQDYGPLYLLVIKSGLWTSMATEKTKLFQWGIALTMMGQIDGRLAMKDITTATVSSLAI